MKIKQLRPYKNTLYLKIFQYFNKLFFFHFYLDKTMQIINIGLFNFLTRPWICVVIFLYIFDVVKSVLVTDPNTLPVLSPFLQKQKYSPDVSTIFQKEYDYIVGE